MGSLQRGLQFHIHERSSSGVYPSFVMLQLTQRCNSRCAMCGIWQEERTRELKTREIAKIFGNRLFDELRWVNITGGEPYLRPDFAKVLEAISKARPSLELFAIATNGLLPDRIVKKTEKALELIRPYGKRMSVSISIDGIGELNDRQRGIPGSYEKALATMRGLSAIDDEALSVGTSTVITRSNIHAVEEIYRCLKAETEHVSMFPVIESEYYGGEAAREDDLTDDEKKKIARFFDTTMSKELNSYYYGRISRMLTQKDAKKRVIPCLAGYRSMYVTTEGDCYPCHLGTEDRWMGNLAEDDPMEIWFSRHADVVRETMKESTKCPRCTNKCDIIANVKDEVFDVVDFYAKRPAKLARLVHNLRTKDYASKIL